MSRLDLLTGKWIEDKKKRNKSPEASVGKEIDAFLKKEGIYFRAIKSDGTKMQNGGWRRSSQGAGISDRLGWIPVYGRGIGIEIKAKGKKRTVTEFQLSFLINLVENGAIGVVADSVEDVRRALTQSKQELIDTLNSYRKTKKEAAHLDLLSEWK